MVGLRPAPVREKKKRLTPYNRGINLGVSLMSVIGKKV